jgi:DNA-3-methyladenine glycosylase
MLSAKFFCRDPLSCARDLIGAELIWGRCSGIVVETEAYCAIGDEAAHTFVRPSAREFVERNEPGAAYVYFSYGVHWMLNVLVKGKTNGFVLFRALDPRQGIGLMQERRGVEDPRKLCSGPGKLCQALGINRSHHEMDLCRDPAHGFRRRKGEIEVVVDARIGITKSVHLPWRFTLKNSAFISRKPKTISEPGLGG